MFEASNDTHISLPLWAPLDLSYIAILTSTQLVILNKKTCLSFKQQSKTNKWNIAFSEHKTCGWSWSILWKCTNNNHLVQMFYLNCIFFCFWTIAVLSHSYTFEIVLLSSSFKFFYCIFIGVLNIQIIKSESITNTKKSIIAYRSIS